MYTHSNSTHDTHPLSRKQLRRNAFRFVVILSLATPSSTSNELLRLSIKYIHDVIVYYLNNRPDLDKRPIVVVFMVCIIIVSAALTHRFVWIGYLLFDADNSVRPLAILISLECNQKQNDGRFCVDGNTVRLFSNSNTNGDKR